MAGNAIMWGTMFVGAMIATLFQCHNVLKHIDGIKEAAEGTMGPDKVTWFRGDDRVKYTGEDSLLFALVLFSFLMGVMFTLLWQTLRHLTHPIG